MEQSKNKYSSSCCFTVR